MSNYTPGPWKWQSDVLVSPGVAPVLFAVRVPPDAEEPTVHVMRQDGLLIAAAPDLYEALSDLMKDAESGEQYNGRWQRACDALAKAEGK